MVISFMGRKSPPYLNLNWSLNLESYKWLLIGTSISTGQIYKWLLIGTSISTGKI
jgi:hypothetical protein